MPNTSRASKLIGWDKVPESFGIEGNVLMNEFVNLYSEDNLILDDGDECFFLLTNLNDYFMPVVCQGKIIHSTFTEGMTKTHLIEFKKFLDTEELVKDTMYDKPFEIYIMKHNQMYKMRRLVVIPKKLFAANSGNNYFNNNDNYYRLFPVNSFFVRGFRSGDEAHYQKQLQNIRKLRAEYVAYLKEDFTKNYERLITFSELM